jgi:hypothetical protein
MKKIILCLAIVCGSYVASNAQAFHFTAVAGNGTIDYDGIIQSWDNNGPHGIVKITVTDGNGNSISWNSTFSDTEVNTDDRTGAGIMANEPEIAEDFENWLGEQVPPKG